jgi:small subunit ribosomal protein S16
MVKIRLRRVGAKKQPSYRVVVTDSRSPRDGRFIETIGHYNPRTEPPTVVIKEERALYWLSQGAQPTDAVNRMLKKLGTWDKLARLRAGEDWETLFSATPAPEGEEQSVPGVGDTARGETGEDAAPAVEVEATEAPAGEDEAAADETL